METLHDCVLRRLAGRHDDGAARRTPAERWLHENLADVLFAPAAPAAPVTVLRPLRLGRGMAPPPVPFVLVRATSNDGVHLWAAVPLFTPLEWADTVNPVRLRGSRIGGTWAVTTFAAAVFAAAEARGEACELSVVSSSRRNAHKTARDVLEWVSATEAGRHVIQSNDETLRGRHCRIAYGAPSHITARARAPQYEIYDGIDGIFTTASLAEYASAHYLPPGMPRVAGVQRDAWDGNADHARAEAAVAARGGGRWCCGAPPDMCRHTLDVVECVHVEGVVVTREWRPQ